MAREYFPGLSKKRTWRNSDPLQRLLSEWYGRDKGANEIISHLPQIEPLKNGIDSALKKLVNPESAFLRKIKDEWQHVAGAQLDKFTKPTSFYKGILYIEVSHPAWLMQLGRQEKNLLLGNIHSFMQNKVCKNIKFVPLGKRKSQNDY
jgi:predicted nucleic acid-binding Zn ribbon protein